MKPEYDDDFKSPLPPLPAATTTQATLQISEPSTSTASTSSDIDTDLPSTSSDDKEQYRMQCVLRCVLYHDGGITVPCCFVRLLYLWYQGHRANCEPR